MSRPENAVSEITAFLLITAVLAAGIGIYAATVLPELEKTSEEQHHENAVSAFCSLKSDIDLLCISGERGQSIGKLIPISSANLPGTAGTIRFGKGTPIRFNHTAGQERVYPALLSYTSSSFRTENTEIIYEGGGIFAGAEKIILPAAVGNTCAVLLCTNDADDVILTNTPVSVTITCLQRETFSGVTEIQISESRQAGYWESCLADISTITVCTVSISLEAVA